jgi:tetratricopeptide (TPR) repeat protein
MMGSRRKKVKNQEASSIAPAASGSYSDGPAMHAEPSRPLPLPLVALLLAVAIPLVYANCLDNAFQLDDSYGLTDNPWIRDLRHIPRYFTDPFTLTSLRANADYRPLLQITYALNYAISGLNTWSWHLLNLLLHFMVSLGVFCLGRVTLGSRRILPISWLDQSDGDLCAAFAALLFAVHPIGTGCVNYLWARSSLLVAALAIPATVAYLVSFQRGFRWRVCAFGLFVLALLTKAEAVSLFGVFFLAELLLSPDAGETPLARRGLSVLLRLLPFALALLLYLGLRQMLLPKWLEDVRHGSDVTSYDYLLTQFRVWWLYIGRMLAPVSLVADDTSYRISRSVADPFVLYSLAGWALALAGAASLAGRAPAVVWFFLIYFVELSPTSSLAPLAEMHNEHRPYLPTAGLWIITALGFFLALRALTPHRPRTALVVVAAVLLPSLGYISRDRNRVWMDDLSLWGDVVEKVPNSSRGQMNYGLALMKRGRFSEAEARFREANRLAPNYVIPWINLGVVLNAQGRVADARAAYDRAVRLDPTDTAPLLWRGRFLESNNDFPGAIADYRGVIARDMAHLDAMARLAAALIRTGHPEEARAYITRGLPLDPAGFRPLLDLLPKEPSRPQGNSKR